MNIKQGFKILEIRETNSPEEIKRAYRDLIAIWHPDRYVHNPRLHQKANEKVKELNRAYHTVMSSLDPGKPEDIFKKGAATTPEYTGLQHTIQYQPKSPRKRTGPKWALLLFVLVLGFLIAFYGDVGHKIFNLIKRLPEGKYTKYFIRERAPSSVRAPSPAEEIETVQRNQILQVQQILKQRGYETGPVDGVWGENTVTAIRRFQADYWLELKLDDVTDVLKALSRQESIIKQQPDWPVISTSNSFKSWIDNQEITSPQTCREIVATGSASQVVSLIDWYKFDKINPKPLPFPPNGIIKKSYYKGLAPLTIRARYDGRHYYLKLIRLSDNSEAFTAFLKSGYTLSEHVPVGKYEIKYAVGKNWYGPKWLFGRGTYFSKMDRVLEFKFQNNEIEGYRLDLYLQPVIISTGKKEYTFDF
jgi:hypothetical protein